MREREGGVTLRRILVALDGHECFIQTLFPNLPPGNALFSTLHVA